MCRAIIAPLRAGTGIRSLTNHVARCSAREAGCWCAAIPVRYRGISRSKSPAYFAGEVAVISNDAEINETILRNISGIYC